MSYMRKDEVNKTLRNDMETTLACYSGKQEREIIRFCYESMQRELDLLSQHVPENLVEKPKIYNVDQVIDKLEEEKEYASEDFEEYVREVDPSLDSEYADTFPNGIERAIKIIKEEMDREKTQRTR